ncbi:MAG: hypothetical protein COB84_02170 [Rhodobacteraceae bacterium]|nr:MAG: hypothetical protein COB84_02170 [Paracoccaceae bacterium]
MVVEVTSLKNTSRDAGFTLIEMAIVIAVLSILTVSVGLGMTYGQVEAKATDDANAFIANFERLKSNAIYRRLPQGVDITASGWHVVPFDSKHHIWGERGRQIRWDGSVDFRKTNTTGFAGTRRVPDIIFLPDGRSTSFEMRFLNSDLSLICSNDGWTGVICAP